MQNWNRFPRALLVFSLLIVLCAGMFVPRVEAAPNYLGTMQIVINEVAWAGTVANANAEWIELYNPSGSAVNLNGWTLRAIDGTPNITLIGTIPANGYYLLERTADTTINDFVADQIYTGALSNTVESLELRDLGNILIDTANQTGVSWFAGSNIGFKSMERKGVANDGPFIWASNNGITINGLDAGGNLIQGTPKQQNSVFTPTPPIEILINEVAWMGTTASPNDEWIELYNPGISDVDIAGWRLVSNDGNPDIVFNSCNPNCTIPAGGYFLLERAHDNVVQSIPANLIFSGQLSDSGEFLTLTKPDATIVDTANSDGGTWPAGISSTFSSMERVGPVADGTLAWTTYQGIGAASDAAGNLINGTPGIANAMVNITPTLTPSITPSPTSTSTLTPTITTTPSGARSVIINEIAWAGTTSGLSDDEWIELYNPGSISISLSGWSLKAADGDPNITFPSGASIPSGGYYLLERDDDNTVSDINADQTYTGTLSNSGESLTLYDAANKVIDTANGNGGAWPAGSSSTYGTMERISTSTESDSSWRTNTGIKKNGKNANGGDILGTPKSSNSPLPTPTPTLEIEYTDTPTPVPTFRPPDPRPIINEFLPRPGFDWNQDGKVNVFDEFIEIKNLTSIDINLGGWKLDDEANLGSSPYTIPDLILKPSQRVVFYALETNILLSDGGDTVRLLDPNGKVYDAYTYTIARAEDQSICRLPDGNVYNGWFEDCIPTPNLTNSHEGVVPVMPDEGYQSPVCQLPDTLPADFLFAECRGYGANIWNADYWDQPESSAPRFIPQNTSKWETILE